MTIRVAVTGAGGKVGAHVLGVLARDPRLSVRGICRNALTGGPLKLSGLDIQYGELSNPASARELLGDCDVVVNCAAAAGMGAAREQNEALARALATVPGPRRIIHFSSVAVYGTSIDPSRNTFENPRPDEPYGIEKLHIEQYLKNQLRKTKVDLTVVRLGHVYGAGQWVSRAVLDFAAGGQGLPFDGALPSNAIHVSNVAAAMRSIITENQSGTMNLTDPGNSSWRQVFDWTTSAASLAPVGVQPPEDAERHRAFYRRQARTPLTLRAAKEATGWMKSLPMSFIAGVPSTKHLGVRLLCFVASSKFEKRVLAEFSRRLAASQQPHDVRPREYLFCDGAPGPSVRYGSEVRQQDVEALALWAKNLASARAILHWGDDEPALPRNEVTGAASA